MSPTQCVGTHPTSPSTSVACGRPTLLNAVADGTVDVAINCGHVIDPPGVVGGVFCGDPVVVEVRTTHRLAGHDRIAWTELGPECFGIPSAHLFPDWSSEQQRLLDDAGISPQAVELEATDVAATGWTRQSEVDWIMTTAALNSRDSAAKILPVLPPALFTYTLQWNPVRVQTAEAARFVQLALTIDVPTDWVTQPGHLRFDASTSQ